LYSIFTDESYNIRTARGKYLQSLVNSDCLIQTKLTYKIDTDLKNIATSIQKFAAEVVVESKPCEMIIVRRKAKQAQMMVAELSPPMYYNYTIINSISR
jgi:hypothetical protein